MTYIYDQFGVPRKLEHLNAVERLEKLKEQSGSNPWPVIDECIKIWQSTNPKEWKAQLIEIQEIRDSRRDKKFASSDPRKDQKHGGILRYTLDIPEKVIYMLRCIYTPQELPMDRVFFNEWARRFPSMKVAEKI